MNCCEQAWNAPFAPGPIDSMRRRQIPIEIKRIPCTLPAKRKLSRNTEIYLTHSFKEPIQVFIKK